MLVKNALIRCRLTGWQGKTYQGDSNFDPHWIIKLFYKLAQK